ncbi:MocR-like pyridoxine biosynthesis transcription factor PdxR [Pontivivens insulae]|uniref:HTH-type transcriptional regulator TauR n=1 Tax=Pontivivens insulae TaxID=1639689 RepID=A0A2R8ADG4_9RHOB|nr:PLP-dependent aminotransferase family protein [Pontivivens insulae]RED14024.1 GntR family transcriptional regulator [Pontivivens insulae]SPF30098.1 HTH-type transcriptional regulator TauR [Pontivivens insulae]
MLAHIFHLCGKDFGQTVGTISEHDIYLSSDQSAGLQTRLKESITKAIWDGRFSPGDRLPASRALANHFGISRITVSLAYEALVATGYVASRARSGFFVADDAPNQRDTVAALRAEDDVRIDWTERLGIPPASLGGQATPTNWREYRFPFVFGEPDLSRFPVDDWRTCVRQASGKRYLEAIADDAADQDDQMLLDQIVKRSLTGRGVSASVKEVLVTAGAQNALWLSARILLKHEPGAVFAIEDPGYPELRNLLVSLGATLAPVPVDDEGIIVDAIPPETRVVCVTPSHQAPTGATMSMKRRGELLARAEAEDFIIIEDDYDFEMSYRSPGMPALKSLDRQGRVVYIGSFSKSMFPGLRLGYLTADISFVERARAARTLTARHPPGLTQRAAACFLSAGHYNAHARRMRTRMERRHAVLREAIEAEGFADALASGFSGAFLWFEGPDGLDADRLKEDLKHRSVLIEPGSSFYAGDSTARNTIRIGFSAIATARIAEGVALICQGIRDQLSEGGAA